MNNSLVTHLSGYIVSLFKDIEPIYIKPSEAGRDQSRLLHELGHQGVSLLTLDFPAALKYFDKSLDQGLYEPSHQFMMGCGRNGLPVFLRDLFLQVFDAGGKLRECPSIAAVIAIRQLLGGVKKLKLQCSDRRTRNAVMDFITIERGSRSPSLSWDEDLLGLPGTEVSFSGDSSTGRPNTSFDLRPYPAESAEHCLDRNAARSLQTVCDIIAAQLGDLHSEESSELPKHGPGVVAEPNTHRSKYEFRYWSRKLNATFPYDWYGSTDLATGHISMSDWPRNHELPSRMIAVPKTQKAPRLIAAEPVEHMWIQQLVRNQLERRILLTSVRHSVHFRDQSENQKFARIGSLDRSLTTVDLSSASDRLTCWTVERAFRSNHTLLERLHACRTRWVRNGLFPELGEFIKLKKFANQGSACTFPVQTIIYTCVAVAAVLVTKNKKVTSASIEKVSRQVRVFGDDIIIPSHSLGVLLSMLAFLGLKVNTDKTYSKGNFRESCGGDYFMGNDVSVAYLSHCKPLNSGNRGLVGSYVEVCNNFYRKNLIRTSLFLEGLIGYQRRYIPVIPQDCDSFGLVSYTGFSCSHLKKRWNKSIHAWEFRGLVPRLRTDYSDTDGSHRLFKWFIEEPRELRYFDSRTVRENESYWTLGWRQLHFYTSQFQFG